MTHKRMPKTMGVVAAVGVAVLGLAGCATPTASASGSAVIAARDDQSPTAYQLLSQLDLSEVANIIFLDTRTLGATSDAVVVGTLRDWLVGSRITTGSGMDVGATILAEIEILEVVHLADGAELEPGDVVYLPLVAPVMDTGELADSLPDGLDVVAYLDGPLTPEQLRVDDALEKEPGDARAAGKPRWIPAMQGLVVTDPEDPGRQIWPMLGSRQAGALREALPGGRLDGLSEAQRALAERNVAELEH